MVLWFSLKYKKFGRGRFRSGIFWPAGAHAPGVVSGTYSPFHQLGGHHAGVSFGS